MPKLPLPMLAALVPGAMVKPPQKGGRGLRKKPGEMNKLEERRAYDLEADRNAGRNLGWWFEAVTFRLADDCRYTPDFMVLGTDGVLHFEETKGKWEDDAKVKAKVFTSMYPFRLDVYLPALVRDGGGWKVHNFKGWTDDDAVSVHDIERLVARLSPTERKALAFMLARDVE